MHLDEGRLELLLHGELDVADDAAARRHLETCATCRDQLDHAQRDEEWLSGVLRALDHETPRIGVEAIVRRSAHRGSRALRWAAGFALLVAAAGTAYAVPGSPVRRWIDRLVGRSAGAERVDGGSPAGVALEPGQRFSITFASPQPQGVVTIALTDGTVVDVRRMGGGATFRAEVDGLVIESGSAALDFQIGIPRAAPWVEILVGSRRVFLKDGSRIVTAAPVDAVGRYILPLRER